ncbi:ribonuclease H-like domain-containing protein [Tanacetum coccineum]
MSFDDLYNNFKIVEQEVKRTVSSSSSSQNMAFVSSPSSTNKVNTAYVVSTANTQVSPASTQKTGRNITINGSDTVGYDKSKVECFNCHKMEYFVRECSGPRNQDSRNRYDKSKVECFNYHKIGHFARECRAPRSKDNRNWNQGSSSKAVRIEDASEKAMCAIDGAGFDWSDMAEDEIQANMALMAFTDSEYDDLLVKLDDTAFKAATYKRGLSILEAQVVKYKESEVLFSEEIALLKRSVGHKDYLMGLVKTELEKVKEEKEGFEFKLAKFEKSSKDLDDLLASQVTDKSKRGFGYTAVPSPHPLILNRPTPLDLSYSGLEEFKQPESNSQLNDKGFVDSGCSRHMSGNIAHLSDFKDFDGGYVTFGGRANGGRITGKCTIKTDKLDFEDVYFVKELKFNPFSISQMCDKKNYVLFTDSECLVLSPNFKLPDENQILLKIPRQNNMYSFD